MKKGNGLIILGLLLLAAALCIVLNNCMENLRAEKASSTILEQMNLSQEKAAEDPFGINAEEQAAYPDYVLNPDMPLPVETVEGRDYVGVLRIPSMEIELPVCSQWNYDNLQKAPCRYAGTPYKDDFVICAHNYDIHFGRIKNLNYGDEVTFTDVEGNLFRYTVGSVETLLPEAIEEMTKSDWDLTLFTCTIGGATRVTVRCEKVK